MADFDPTFGCGSYLPGYGLPTDFVPPTSTGQPDGDDGGGTEPSTYCVLGGAGPWVTKIEEYPLFYYITITQPLVAIDTYENHSWGTEWEAAQNFAKSIVSYLESPGLQGAGSAEFVSANFGSYFAVLILFGLADENLVKTSDGVCKAIEIKFRYPKETSPPPQITMTAPPLEQSPIEYVTALFTIEVHPGNVTSLTHVVVSFGDGTSPVSVPYAPDPDDPTSPTEYDFSHTYNTDGTFNLTVKVHSSGEITEAEATFPIVVQDSPTTVTITDPGTVTVGIPFDVEATTTVAGGGAPTFIYEWFTKVASQGYVSEGGGNPKSLSFDTPGSVDIKVEASVGGEVLSSDEITIVVLPSNPGPGSGEL